MPTLVQKDYGPLMTTFRNSVYIYIYMMTYSFKSFDGGLDNGLL